jgi:hypothetical protein
MPSFTGRASLAIAFTIALASPTATAAAQTLRGSAASVDLMYTSAHTHDLAFLKTQADVYAAEKSGALEVISVTDDLKLDKVAYPFVLPNTHRFADSLAAKYHAACGERLEVTSGVRPIDEQPRNASPKSVHPTGMAVDFHKPTGKCLAWLRKSLLDLEERHVIEATEERHPPHFHVAVLSQLREPPIRLATSAVGAPPVAASTAASTAAAPTTATGSASAGDVTGAATKPVRYKVRAGDNLWTIAERHNTTADNLKALNALRSSRIKVGQEIRLR